MRETDAPAPIQWVKWAMVLGDAALLCYLAWMLVPETKKIEWRASITREKRSAEQRKERRRIEAQMRWELNEILSGEDLEVEA